jgi:Cu-Zn family superoxide dismutase
MKAVRRIFLIPLVLPALVSAADITVDMHAVTDTGIGDSLGTIVISDATHGVLLTPMLSGLPPGGHGFHVHQVPDCNPAKDDSGKLTAALAAGDHLDPEDTDRHSSPLVGDGHLGDLPVLMVDVGGRAATPVEASRLSFEDLDNHALIIHSGGDNYSDAPEPLGGGGARIACGIIDRSGQQSAADPQLRIDTNRVQ